MVLLCFIWFSALYFGTYKLASYQDFFAPLKFLSVKYAVTSLPFIFYIYLFPENFFRSILRVCNTTLDDAFLQYTYVQTAAFLCLILGVVVVNLRKKRDALLLLPVYNYKNIKVLAFCLFCAGIIVYTVYLSRIGGIVNLLSNLDKRIELQSGQYILKLLPILYFPALLLLICIKLRNKTADKIAFVFYSITAILIFSSFGARKNALIFIITIIVAYHYIVNKIKFNRTTFLAFASLSLFVALYILIIPVLRTGNSEFDNGHKSKLRVKNLMYDTSYTFIDIFAANYYNSQNAWHLKGFFDPVTVALSKGDKAMLPPVDQGAYFSSIVKFKKHFEPSVPRSQLSGSWPIENFGFAFANFQWLGIVVFFFLQGAIFSLSYNHLSKQPGNPFLIAFYVFMIFNFNFSNLRLIQFISTTPLMYLGSILYNKFCRK